MLNSGWVLLLDCFTLSHMGWGMEEVGWKWVYIMEGICMEKGCGGELYYLLIFDTWNLYLLKKNSGNTLRWVTSNLSLCVGMWVSESPEIIFMRNEAFHMYRMTTPLLAWGNMGLLIHVWTLNLLLIAMLCDGWNRYLVFVFKSLPQPQPCVWLW